MVLGIDLGTTYSVAAYVDSETGAPNAIHNSEGDTTTPSVVYFENEKKVVVGQVAKDFLSTEPKRVVKTVKNSMGEDKHYSPVDGMDLLPQDVSCFVLKKLVKDAEMALNTKEPIKDVVVTVPAYFTEAQRKATREAVSLAGLNLLSNINEPTAAAIYYAYKNKMEKANTLVFDLGGGTFDVTVMQIDGADVQVKSTGGLKNVGGSFFDEQLVEYVCEQFEERHGIDLEDDEYTDVYNSLFEKVEKAKIQICSTKTQTVIPINAGTKKDRVEITYDFFTSVIRRLCDRIEVKVKGALNDAGMSASDIDQVIMVGGSSRIPYIEERISCLIGKKPLKVVNPDEVVALGAAIQADRLFNKKVNLVKDVCSHGIGFLRYSPKENKRKNVVMITRNTQIPASATSNEFAFAKDGQEYLNLAITEGDYEDIEYAVIIKELKVKLPENVKRGMKYKVTIKADSNQNMELEIKSDELENPILTSIENEKGNETAETDEVDVDNEKMELISAIEVA